MVKHSEEIKSDPPKVSSETYIQLAKLGHESFNQRRSYEWKVHLGLWSSVGLVVYVAIKEQIEIPILWLILAATIVFIAYTIHLMMVSWGHWTDKKYKHYYTRKAEGNTEAILEEDGKRPEDIEWKKIIDAKHVFWISSYLLFAISLLFTAVLLLDANNKKITTLKSNKPETGQPVTKADPV